MGKLNQTLSKKDRLVHFLLSLRSTLMTKTQDTETKALFRRRKVTDEVEFKMMVLKFIRPEHRQ